MAQVIVPLNETRQHYHKEPHMAKNTIVSTKQFVSALAAELGLSKKATREILDTTFISISETILSGSNLRINGFGTFVNFVGADKVKRAKFKAAAGLKKAMKAS